MHSTVYTIGTALGRAREHGVEVRLLVSGQWIEGAVSEIDGHGVILTGPDSSHHVVRLTDVSAVTVSAHRPAWETAQPETEPAWWKASADEEEEPGDQDDETSSLLVAR